MTYRYDNIREGIVGQNPAAAERASLSERFASWLGRKTAFRRVRKTHSNRRRFVTPLSLVQWGEFRALHYVICHTAMRSTSRRPLLGDSTAAGSKPQWTRQCSAAGIAAGAEPVPVGRLDQLAIGRVVGVGQQVAGASPAADVVGGIGPGGAGQLALAARENPGRSARPSAGTGASSGSACAELLVDLVAGHEDLLGARRDRPRRPPRSRRPARS